MKDSKSTKRALAASIGCVALCTAMLVGTTFAWFTDTASTSVNKIQSGTLDVALVGADDSALESLSFVNKDESTDILWEPGATFTTGAFYVKNDGSLALKYKLSIDGVDGDDELLSAIDFSVVDKNGDTVGLSDFEGHLTATDPDNKSGAYKIKGHMKESAGNEYQDKTLEGIKVFVTATQDTVEFDSTANQYDSAAEYATPVSTTEDLKAAIAKGENVVVTENIVLPSALDVTGNVTIYGSDTGKLISTDSESEGRVINVNNNATPVTLTLSGVDIVGPTDNSLNRGVTVYGNSDVTIVMDNCSASANHYAFNIADNNEKVSVTVRNSTLTGYSAFQTTSANTNATFENCTLTGWNQWPEGSNNYAAIVIATSASGSNLTFTNCRIESKMTGEALEAFLFAWGANSQVAFNDCTFYLTDDDSTVELTSVDEIAEWIGADESATVTIN